VAAHRGLARFVGRQRELEQMQRALELDVHFVNPVPVFFGRDNG
jgi:hypothetical protein